ncbi:GumC family protein [Vibrio sp. TRT 17S01]|uniref:GumC family protein n=1 Tax=Vibrio sp. TRT 17S01 TaxID=3418505 RepID=UPI003CF5F7FA
MQLLSSDNVMSSNDSIDVAKYFNLVKSNLIRIILFSSLTTLIAILVVLSLTPKYQSTATLLIESKANNAVSIKEVVGVDSQQKEYYKTQFAILQSRRIAEQVVEKLSLTELPEFNPSLNKEKSLLGELKSAFRSIPLFNSSSNKPKLSAEELAKAQLQNTVEIFRSKLTITPLRGTQLVDITYESTDAQLAADIANAVGEAYIDDAVNARIDATAHASTWISGRLETLKEELRKSEQALIDFLAKEKLIDDSGIDAQASSVINDLTLRLSETTEKRIELESAYNTLRNSKNMGDQQFTTIPAINSHQQVVSISSLLADSEKEVTELSKRYGPKHGAMQAAIAKRDNLKQQLSNVIKQLVSGLGQELNAVRSQERLIKAELDKKVGEFQSLTVKKRQYDALVREEQTNRNILNIFLNREKETSATVDFDAKTARFTDVAIASQYPAKPRKKVIVMFVFVASFGFAIFALLILDALRNTFETTKEFEEKIGLIPLGGITKVKPKLLPKGEMVSKVYFDEKLHMFSESVRSIRTAILLACGSKGQKTVVISSSVPGEGKTTTAINLAQAFAQMEKVLLIDADLRKPMVSERFGLTKFRQGLTNHLLMGASLEECIFKDEESGVDVLPAGMLTPKPQELLSSNSFRELILSLEQKYDKIIIDTPPTLPVSDSLVVGKLVGSVVLVVKANSTKVNTVKNTLSRYISHEVKVEGVVLNQINEKGGLEDSYTGYGVYQEKELSKSL